MSRNSSPPPPLPPPRFMTLNTDEEDRSLPDIAWMLENARSTAATGSTLYGSSAVSKRALVEERSDLDRRQRSPADSVTGEDSRREYPWTYETSLSSRQNITQNTRSSYDSVLLKKLDLRRAQSPPEHDDLPPLRTTISASDLYRKTKSASRRPSLSRSHLGYAGSDHSSSSIRSYGSYDSYTCSVRSARGFPDQDIDNGLSRLSPGGLPMPYSAYGIPDVSSEISHSLEEGHQTWEEFCDLHLLAFLQFCTLADVYAIEQSPALLQECFKIYLKRMISQGGNADFLSYQASPRPGQPEGQLNLPRHHKSMFSQSKPSIRSYSSRTSQSSTSTASSFSSQISDGTMLNHVQLEARGLKDCIIKIQKKLKYLENEPQGAQSSKDKESPAAELPSPRVLLEANEKAIQLLQSREGQLSILGFSDMSLLFAEYKGEFTAVYKDLKDMKRQKKFQRVFRPGRSRQEIGERHEKYARTEELVRKMIDRTFAALETAEVQKDAFMTAGRPYASLSIMESTAELGYAPEDKYAGISGTQLVMRQFLKLEHHRLQRSFICECCPKKPKKFKNIEELNTHEQEKQYECTYCKDRFKNENEAERHQNSLHLRRHSWSCAALTGCPDTFSLSPTNPNEVDICGYCGEEFLRTGPADERGVKITLEKDWDLRVQHLSEVHKFGECNQAKKFFRVDHFRQHLKHCHAGTSGKWTKMLEDTCMKDEPQPELRHRED